MTNSTNEWRRKQLLADCDTLQRRLDAARNLLRTDTVDWLAVVTVGGLLSTLSDNMSSVAATARAEAHYSDEHST
jgi:hypothetical protein